MHSIIKDLVHSQDSTASSRSCPGQSMSHLQSRGVRTAHLTCVPARAGSTIQNKCMGRTASRSGRRRGCCTRALGWMLSVIDLLHPGTFARHHPDWLREQRRTNVQTSYLPYQPTYLEVALSTTRSWPHQSDTIPTTPTASCSATGGPRPTIRARPRLQSALPHSPATPQKKAESKHQKPLFHDPLLRPLLSLLATLTSPHHDTTLFTRNGTPSVSNALTAAASPALPNLLVRLHRRYRQPATPAR